MTIKEVLKFYGSFAKMELVTKIHCSNATYWKKIGFIPYRMQLRLESITKGKLKANIRHTDY